MIKIKIRPLWGKPIINREIKLEPLLEMPDKADHGKLIEENGSPERKEQYQKQFGQKRRQNERV